MEVVHREEYWENIFQSIKNELRKEYKTIARSELVIKQNKSLEKGSKDKAFHLHVTYLAQLNTFDAVSTKSSEFLFIISPNEWLELQERIKEKFLSSYQAEVFCSLCHKGGFPEYKKRSSGVHHSTHTTYGFEGYCQPQNLTECLSCGKLFCQEHLYNGRCFDCNKPEVIEIHHYY